MILLAIEERILKSLKRRKNGRRGQTNARRTLETEQAANVVETEETREKVVAEVKEEIIAEAPGETLAEAAGEVIAESSSEEVKEMANEVVEDVATEMGEKPDPYKVVQRPHKVSP